MKRLIQKALYFLGYEIHRTFSQETVLRPEFQAFFEIVRPYTMLTAARLETVYDQVLYLEENRIEGSFVECGVWRGGCAGLMALAHQKYGNFSRCLHLFDTFEGIPEPDATVDGDRAVREAQQAGVQALGRLVPNPQFYERMGRPIGDLTDCRHLLEELIGFDAAHLEYHKGFFQQTIPEAAGQMGKIALLHLDGDWHDSTRVCLDFLYDLVVPGGLITVDDYGAYDGCKKAVDDFFATRDLRPYLHRVDTEMRVFSKPDSGPLT